MFRVFVIVACKLIIKMFEEKEDENVLDYLDSESQNLSFIDETKIRKKMSLGTWLGTPKYRESIVSIATHSNKSQNLPSTTEVPACSKG
jgi:hypothetical protein